LNLPPSEMRTTAVHVGSDTKPITPL